MIRSLALSVSVLLVSVLVYSKPSAHVLLDGSVARCNELGDVGYRAYRLKIISIKNNIAKMSLDTLICQAKINIGSSGVELVSFKFSEKIIYKNDTNTMSYEIKTIDMAVTNTDGTQELARINLNPRLNHQEFSIVLNQQSQVDLTIVGLEVILLNGELYDQGMTFGGHYRLRLKD